MTASRAHGALTLLRGRGDDRLARVESRYRAARRFHRGKSESHDNTRDADLREEVAGLPRRPALSERSTWRRRRAISLTERVRTPARATGTGSTFSAYDLRVFLDGLGRLGYDADRLLAAGGLRETDLSAPDAKVSCEVYGDVLARAQYERFTPNLALELARVTPLGAWPLIDYLVLTVDSVGDGVHQLARCLCLTSSPVGIIVRENVDPIRVEMTAPVPFAIEYDAALIILHFRGETDGRFAPAAVSFQHTPDEQRPAQ